MTKRILAAFLAVMMVVGLVPTSVFAVTGNNGCAVLDAYEDHSKEHCTNAGVAYTEVPNSTVKPECGQDGYTLYQCACGAYFADDIVPMQDHHTASGVPTTERVEPTCYATGKVAIFTCDECGKTYLDPNDKDGDSKGNIKKTAHTFDQISYPGNDCTASEQICENEGCGAKNTNHKPAGEHKWTYNDPHAIVKAPTAHDDGEAVFYCGNEGCAQHTETVKVHALDHKSVMTHVAAVAPDCWNKGNIEYWHCDDCDKNFVEEQGLMVEVANVVLDEEHDWNQDPTIVPPTCETWGFSYYGCPTCGAKKDLEQLKPLLHTTFEEAKEKGWLIVTEGTCEVGTKYEWTCHNFANGVDGALCGKYDFVQDAPIGHTNDSFKVPATCKFGYEYTVVYCTNENCTKAACSEYKKGTTTYDVTVTVKDGNVYDGGEELQVVDITAVKKVTKPTAHFYTMWDINQNTCTEPGKEFYVCASCREAYVVDTAPLGHTYEDTTTDKAADCYNNAVQYCDRCNEPKELPGTAGHVWADEKEFTSAPTCQGAFGYDWYPCIAGCGEYDKRNETKFVANKTYATKEEAQAEHVLGALVNELPGTCATKGYWEYNCTACNKDVLITISGTGEGHLVPDGTVYHEEATCYHGKGYETYVCARPGCGQTVKAASALAHKMSKVVAEVPATCEQEGTKAYYTCTRECCEGILFKDSMGKTPYAQGEEVIPALNHKIVDVVVAVNCTTPGFTAHYCENAGCELKYVDGYVAPTGHAKADKAEIVEETCTADGSETYKCENAGCTGDDGIAGNEDDGIVSFRVLEKTGHTNKAGQTIVDICTDSVKDRVCVNKNCPLTAVGGKKTVAKSHNVVEVTVYAGCEHYGYKMETCANGCGDKDKVINITEPTGHLAPWNENYKHEEIANIIVNEDDIATLVEAFLNNDPATSITDYQAPTYEALGTVTFKCGNHCGDELTVKVLRTGVDFTMDLYNAVAPEAEGIVDGDVISVDIYANAYDTDVWGFNFKVDYTAAGLKYLGHVYHAADAFSRYDVKNKVADIVEKDAADADQDGIQDEVFNQVDGGKGTISVTAYTENMVGGQKVDTKLNGSLKVVTLYFQVEAGYTGIDQFIKYEDGKQYANILQLNQAKAAQSATNDEFACAGAEANFTADVLLDVNGSGDVTAYELMTCYDICNGIRDEYLSASDADKDGDIDLMDMYLINGRALDMTDADIYAQLAWNAPEGFVAAN